MIIFPVAISGAGKSTYGEQLKEKIKNLVIVCPDRFRLLLTGDISNHTMEPRVWMEVAKALEENVIAGKTIYFDATNLTKRNRKTVMDIAKKYEQEVIAVIFHTSLRPDICEDRVRRDLGKSINRSNTLIRDDNGDTVVRRQYKQFGEIMKNFSAFEKELEENSKSYRIKYIECSSE